MLDTVKEMASSFVFKHTPQSVVRRNLQLNIINGDTSGAMHLQTASACINC